jgi:hypothetical protein
MGHATILSRWERHGKRLLGLEVPVAAMAVELMRRSSFAA